MTELQILSVVKNNGGSIGYVDLLNIGLSDMELDSLADRDLIREMIQSGVLSGNQDAYTTIHLGKKGRLRLKELQEQEQQRSQQAAYSAKQKSDQFRHDWAVAIASGLIGTVFGVFSTIAVQIILGLISG